MESIFLGLVLVTACVLALKAPKLFKSKESVMNVPARVFSRSAKVPSATLPNNWGGRMDYCVTFSLEDGTVELSVNASQYTQLVEGTQGQLRYQGTKLVSFSPDGETEAV